MPSVDSNRPLLASILDRLIDQDPATKSEARVQSQHLLRDLRGAVRRDLEALLNTRQRCMSWPEEFADVGASIVGYGVPDPSSSALVYEKGRERFLLEMKRLIETFEPRLSRVRVYAERVDESKDRALRFRIEAVLNAQLDPEEVRFTTRLEPVRRSFEVQM